MLFVGSWILNAIVKVVSRMLNILVEIVMSC